VSAIPSEQVIVIATIARREIKLQFRDGRLRLAFFVLIAALSAACVSGWMQLKQASHQQQSFEKKARDQWLTQGERHPHRAAHFGTYVTKPELSLAFFEPGLRAFAGQTLWLEAHDRPAFANVRADDDLTLTLGPGAASGAAILQLLGGLLALCMGALSVAGDRESGVLRQVLAQGVGLRTWLAGKTLGLTAILLIPFALAVIAVVAGALIGAPAPARGDVAARASLLLLGNAMLLLALLAAGVAISASTTSVRAALTAALAVWIGGFVLAPRAAAMLAEWIAPTPSLAEYRAQTAKLFREGFDERGGYDAQLQALQQRTLREYGVETLAELPVGFSGIRMKHMDAWSAEVDDREFAELERTYERQFAIRMAASALAPFIAARQMTQGMAGTDWSHYQHFLAAAERYRRAFGRQMNELIEHRVAGESWEMDGTDADWATVEPLRYSIPDVRWALREQAIPALILLAWTLAVTAGGLAFASRRLKP
jgi:ABC-2 type transport system permease protein